MNVCVCVCVLGLLSSVSSILSLNTTLSHINGSDGGLKTSPDRSHLNLTVHSKVFVDKKETSLLALITVISSSVYRRTVLILILMRVPLHRYKSVGLPVSTAAQRRSCIFLKAFLFNSSVLSLNLLHSVPRPLDGDKFHMPRNY